MEQKYGTNVLNSDPSISSDSEDESDDPSEVSEETETQFLKTLSLLKTKDPRIYDPGFKFFDEKEKESGTSMWGFWSLSGYLLIPLLLIAVMQVFYLHNIL